MNVLLILAAFACGVFFVRGVSIAISSYRTKNWEQCIGELTKWDIYNDLGTEENRVMIKAFCYKYNVSGKEYEPDKIGFGFPRGSSSLSGKRVLDEILANTPTVTVYYSPSNPQNSVLCTGIKYYHIEYIAMFGLVMIVFLAIAATQPSSI